MIFSGLAISWGSLLQSWYLTPVILALLAKWIERTRWRWWKYVSSHNRHWTFHIKGLSCGPASSPYSYLRDGSITLCGMHFRRYGEPSRNWGLLPGQAASAISTTSASSLVVAPAEACTHMPFATAMR